MKDLIQLTWQLNSMGNRYFLISAFLLTGLQVPAQTDTTKATEVVASPAKIDKLLLFNLNESGSRWFRVTFLNQVWVRFNESNPGTQVQGEAAPQTFDLGLRRTRIQLFGQITERTFLYFQFGTNNVNSQALVSGSNNRKVQAFFHDAVGEYKVFKGQDWLKIGGGLTIVNGLSRFSSPSVSTILTMDVPVFLQTTVDQTDQFSRKMSLYARGQVGKWDYRMALTDPYPFANSGNAPTLTYNQATFAGYGHHKQYQAQLMYMFFDKEDHTTPGYMTGSYLGKKKILTVGGGIIYQSNATWYQKSNGSAIRATGTSALLTTANPSGVASTSGGIPIPNDNTVFNDMLHIGFEVFYDGPINKEKGTNLTLMVGFYSTNYGKNYIRYNGTMNPAPSNALYAPATNTNSVVQPNNVAAQPGNAYPMFGTGNNVFAQAAYLFKRDLLGDKGTLQPYVCGRFTNYQALKDPMQAFNAGLNWLIEGHKSKISLDWELRPVYKTDGAILQRNSQIVLQYQIAI